MGEHQHVRQIPERTALRQRLLLEDVETGGYLSLDRGGMPTAAARSIANSFFQCDLTVGVEPRSGGEARSGVDA